MKFMTKRVLLLFALLLCLTFSACGSTTLESTLPFETEDTHINTPEVPESLVENDIFNKFDDNISYSIEHEIDDFAHIDTVTIEVIETEAYYRTYIIGTIMYQYEKESDIWYKFDDPEWEKDRVEYLSYMYEGTWEGTFNKGKGEYHINLEAVDFENETVAGYFSAYYSTIRTGGFRVSYELDTSGTYNIYQDKDGYKLELTQDGITFVFMLHKYYGIVGSTIYDSQTGYSV